MPFCCEEYTDICISFMGVATVTPLLLLTNIGNDILDDKSLIDECSFAFTSTCVKRALFLV